jgi:RNA polymerase sigma-70 factor (ECF subfamily)
MDTALRETMLGSVPKLRALAISICRNVDRADDLVQETMVRAIANIDSFIPGTNMPAWLSTILFNHFRSEYRKRRREVEDVDGHYEASLQTSPEQDGHLEFTDLLEVLDKVPRDQRQALILVGASGFSYEETAKICGCAVGTVKSRVSRARTTITEMLHAGDNRKIRPYITLWPVPGAEDQ